MVGRSTVKLRGLTDLEDGHGLAAHVIVHGAP